jgi:hypothetical protein
VKANVPFPTENVADAVYEIDPEELPFSVTDHVPDESPVSVNVTWYVPGFTGVKTRVGSVTGAPLTLPVPLVGRVPC